MAEFIDEEGVWEQTEHSNGVLSRRLLIPSATKLAALADSEVVAAADRADRAAKLLYPDAQTLSIAMFQDQYLNDPEAAAHISTIQTNVTTIPDAEPKSVSRSLWGRIKDFFSGGSGK